MGWTAQTGIIVHILAEFQRTYWICLDACRVVAFAGLVRALQAHHDVVQGFPAPGDYTSARSSLLHDSDNKGNQAFLSERQRRLEILNSAPRPPLMGQLFQLPTGDDRILSPIAFYWAQRMRTTRYSTVFDQRFLKRPSS